MKITLKYRINGVLFRLRFDSVEEAQTRAAVLVANGIPVVWQPRTTKP